MAHLNKAVMSMFRQASGGGGGGSYADEVMADSPVGYWRLGELSGPTAADASGNGYSGTATGGVTFGTPGLITGDADTAVTLDGINGIVTASGVPAPSTTGGLSLEAWINPTITGNHVILCSGTPFGWLFRLTSSGLQFWPNTGTGNAAVSVSISGRTHVGVTHDAATNTTIFYVNGVALPATTVAGASGHLIADSGVIIGAYVSSWYFDGVIDEVAVYGTVLSAAQILAHYNEGV